MNILIIAPDFYPNSTGFANATMNLIHAVRKYDNTMNFYVYTNIALNDNPEYEEAIVFRSKNGHIIKASKQYKEICDIVDKNKIDFILFETNIFVFLQDKVLKRYPNKVAVRIHSTADTEVMVFKNKISGIKERIVMNSAIKFMKNCNTIICTNSYHQKFVFKEFYNDNPYIMWKKKHYLLPNTVQINSCESVQGDYILTLGKMSYDGYLQKGISDLISALYFLKTKGIFVKTKIIGDGPYLTKFLDIIEKLGLKEYVELINKLSHNEVIEYIKKSKAVCLVSRYEGQSMFATESLACGKPLVLTTDNGMKDMLIDGYNGYAVETGNAMDIANNIEKIIKMKKEELCVMGNNSRNIFEDKFSEKSVYDQFKFIINTFGE